MTNDENSTCIRLEANQTQINSCKLELTLINESIEKVAKILNLAGNETRLKILYLLNQEKELCPCDLADILEMTVSAISQHLRKLRDANIIKRRKAGQTIFYALVEENNKILEMVLENVVITKKVAIL
jgi:DNA-binding transcriptional ArsR family regulator